MDEKQEEGDSGAAFKLSFAGRLPGPSRCAAVDDDDGFVASTTGGVVHHFRRIAAREFESSPVMNGQRLHGLKPGLMLALCKHRKGEFVSGGSDKVGLVWSVDGRKLGQLVGPHQNAVNSVAQRRNGDIITGSFDGTAIVWRKGKVLYKLQGHANGVEVLALPTGEFVTASGTRDTGDIRIWKDNVLQRHLENAHSRIIRRLAPHALGFTSCGNDGNVKVWSNTGDELMSVCAHPVRDDTDSFVYSLAFLPSTGEVVSVGEDGFARVIAPDGTIAQSIRHPSPVRDVAVMPNGDFVTACTDGVVRVWTRSPTRTADDAVIAAYEEIVQLAETSKMQGIDQSQLSDKSVLTRAGERPGQVVIVELEGQGPTVFQWDADASTWQEIGAAMGKAKKPKLDGVEYDHVVDVVVRDGAPATKLGFNKADDPSIVARDFCTRYGLGEEAIPQIIEYLTPLADPVAHLAKAERDRHKRRMALRHIPAWKASGYQTFFTMNLKQLQSKLRELNDGFHQEAHQLTEQDLAVFDAMVALLQDRASYLNPDGFTAPMYALVLKLLQWPVHSSLPVLDLLRMLMVHIGAASSLSDSEIVNALLRQATNGGPMHRVLVARTFCNWVAKRPRDASTESLAEILTNVLNGLRSWVSEDIDATGSAFVMLCHNIVCLFGRQQVSGGLQVLDSIAVALLQYLATPHKEKPSFFALAAVGTVIFVSKSLKESHGSAVRDVVTRSRESSNPNIVALAAEVTTLLEA